MGLFCTTVSWQVPDFYANIVHLVSSDSPLLIVYDPPEAASVLHPRGTRALRNQEREGNTRSSNRRKSFVWVYAKWFWCTIYCTNHRTKPDSQSGSLSHRGMVKWAPRIIYEYNLATTVDIWPLIQPRMCDMGSSIFASMSRLKFTSTTMASFTRMASTERTNG